MYPNALSKGVVDRGGRHQLRLVNSLALANRLKMATQSCGARHVLANLFRTDWRPI